MKKITFILLLVFAANFVGSHTARHSNEGIIEDITLAIKTGNAKELSKYFSSTIDLTLPGYEGVFSKAQSEQILKDFFSKYPPASFSIIHQGASKDGSQYCIGSYVSGNKTYRTYFLLKKSNNSTFIQQLRFEAE